MADKKLANLSLFVAGNASQAVPSRAFMTYDVIAGKAKKTNCGYEFPDIEPDKKMSEVWAEGVAQIKENEGIE